MMLDYSLDPDKLCEETVGNTRSHEQFMTNLNYLIEEGFIEVEEDESGQIRLYPAR